MVAGVGTAFFCAPGKVSEVSFFPEPFGNADKQGKHADDRNAVEEVQVEGGMQQPVEHSDCHVDQNRDVDPAVAERLFQFIFHALYDTTF